MDEAKQLKARIEKTNDKMISNDHTQWDTLTKHHLIGDLAYSTIYGYFALNDVEDIFQSRAADVVSYRSPSFGLFATKLQNIYLFGIPRDVSFTGMSMDVDHISRQVVSRENVQEKGVQYMMRTGLRLSAMEHAIPEMMFANAEGPIQAFSAVKALTLANEDGQRLWTIDQANLENALAAINLDSGIESEIRSAVNSGKIATTHEYAIIHDGIQMAGYVLIDPTTGGGAYKISGGENGSLIVLAYTLMMIIAIAGFAVGGVVAPVIGVMIAVTTFSDFGE